MKSRQFRFVPMKPRKENEGIREKICTWRHRRRGEDRTKNGILIKDERVNEKEVLSQNRRNIGLPDKNGFLSTTTMLKPTKQKTGTAAGGASVPPKRGETVAEKSTLKTRERFLERGGAGTGHRGGAERAQRRKDQLTYWYQEKVRKFQESRVPRNTTNPSVWRGKEKHKEVLDD